MMQRWYPFSDMRQMQNNMDRMWRRFGTNANPGSASESREFEAWAVPLDVFKMGEDTVIRASMPGVSPQDIQVFIEDNVLTIKGHTAKDLQESDGAFLMRERRSGSFHRALRLPDWVDSDNVQPHYEHGVLTITVPKAEAKRAKQLEVQFASPSTAEES